MKRTPSPSASDGSRGWSRPPRSSARAARRSRATWRPTRPKPQMMWWSVSESIILCMRRAASRSPRWPATKNSYRGQRVEERTDARARSARPARPARRAVRLGKAADRGRGVERPAKRVPDAHALAERRVRPRRAAAGRRRSRPAARSVARTRSADCASPHQDGGVSGAAAGPCPTRLPLLYWRAGDTGEPGPERSDAGEEAGVRRVALLATLAALAVAAPAACATADGDTGPPAPPLHATSINDAYLF